MLLTFWKLEYEQKGRGEVIGMLFYLTWYFIVITKTLQNNDNNKKNLYLYGSFNLCQHFKKYI
jgi:hypothetical protein